MYTPYARKRMYTPYARKRKSAATRIVADVLVMTAIALAGGWALMAAVHIAGEVWHFRTLGYWNSVLLLLLIRAVVSCVAPHRREASDA